MGQLLVWFGIRWEFSVKINTLQDLKQVQKKLAEAHAKTQEQAFQRAELEKQREAERHLFVRAVGMVKRLPVHDQVRLEGPGPAPIAHQRQKDDAAVLRDCLSDEFDASTLLDTDEALSFRRPGIGSDVTHKLRKGDWSIQREIDLHGLRSEQARVALAEFIRIAHRQGLRCLRVVHGKGLGSPGKSPILKSKVHSWLIQKNQVMAFVQAKPAEGGAGALVVLLKPAN
ncbi:MAG: DNA mismatch repair protein MutS [Comamonadaceae bacterium PBBC1]|nr:MAG: DNA mismatch repair protein MutS [Comamonadaceae bacterium PBBC1]